jgi:hypothetical protein
MAAPWINRREFDAGEADYETAAGIEPESKSKKQQQQQQRTNG